MATVLAHAAIPWLTGRALRRPRKLTATGAALACAADLDMLGYAFDLRNEDLWGHRGLTHSLAAGLALGTAAAFVFFSRAGLRSADFRRALLFLCFAGVSHGLLDALTFGAIGVALLAPFTAHRFLFPLHLVPVLPLGIPEVFSKLGLQVLADELLWMVAPWALLLEAAHLLSSPARRTRRVTMVFSACLLAWLSTFVSLRRQLPEVFGPPAERKVRLNRGEGTSDRFTIIPLDGLPEGRLVTRLDELKQLGLFGRRLEPEQHPWSGAFFPSWFGSEAGRWTDPHLTLMWRTALGFAPPEEAEAKALLQKAQAGDAEARARLFRLSPTEKYDLAVGDYAFRATKNSLLNSHNAEPKPRFWDGLCNGVAAAALEEPEPFNTVEVVNPDGFAVTFHPNDLKALLALTYFRPARAEAIGVQCISAVLDNGRVCSMNPAGYVVAVLNRIGLAHRSFLVDVHPSPQIQFYAVAAAQVTLGEEHPPSAAPLAPELEGKVARLVDFDSTLELSSTTLSSTEADRPDPSAPGRYQKVGVRAVPFHYTGQLAVDEKGELIGGRWTGDPADGPDCFGFLLGGPKLTDAGTLEVNPRLRPELILRLAHASAEDGGRVEDLLDAGTPTGDELDGG